MPRRSRLETQINHERWLVSYADFITLLFAFFVVMYSVSQVNESKYRTLSATLQAAFSGGAEAESGASSESPVSDEYDHNAYLATLGDIAQQMDALFEDGSRRDGVLIRGNENWLELEFDANLLFASGSDALNKPAQTLLFSVAEVLSPYDNAIAIEGHTDNLPINNGKYLSNWQLASARAVSVVSYLAFQGIAPRRLSAEGYGEYRPVVANDSAEGRARNRRVVLKISSDAVPGMENSDMKLFDDPETFLSSDPRADQPASSTAPLRPEGEIMPVRLRGGGLLFSSDPDLPRANAPIETDETPDPSE